MPDNVAQVIVLEIPEGDLMEADNDGHYLTERQF